MELKELQQNWEELAQRDALWAILSYRDKRNGRWDPNEFFKTGEDDIRTALDYARSVARPFGRRRALDFGCGVGRLTQALCRDFDSCDGIDVAPSMIRLAEHFNRHPARCRYHLNERDDLQLFADGTFDFVYSKIVLQHMKPDLAARYLAELFRVLAPSGVLLFQIPSELVATVTDYDRVIAHIRTVVGDVVPAGAQTLVVSKGDEQLLALGSRPARHFPHSVDGAYMGHHPADSASAIGLLERSREAGARFLVIPGTALWWLEHYAEFREHLHGRCRRVWSDPGCVVYELAPGESAPDAHPDAASGVDARVDPGARARITVRQAPTDVLAGTTAEISVTVQNVGERPWPGLATPGASPVRLGNHWCDAHGVMLIMDDSRENLPTGLDPGQASDLSLIVTTPSEPGEYLLELDLVQEGVCWFKDLGSDTVRIRVSVRAAPNARPRTGAAPLVPRMEMYGIPRHRVIELLGPRNVVDVQRDHSAGPEWISFTYCVQKAGADAR